jgi:class 3 adenylate cyclase/HAMP domain-containing protein
MIRLSFALKLVLAMMLVVGGVTAATLMIGQRKLQEANRRNFEQEFRSEVALFTKSQEARLGAVKTKAREFARNKRLFAAVEDWDNNHEAESAENLYKTAKDNFGPDLESLSFYRFVDANGKVVPPPPELAKAPSTLESQIESLKLSFKADRQEVGYLVLPDASGGSELHEAVLTTISDVDNPKQSYGGLIIGFPMASGQPQPEGKGEGVLNGLLLNGQLYFIALDKPARGNVAQRIVELISNHTSREDPGEGSASVNIDGMSHTLFFRPINSGSHLPQAWQISLHSMAQALEQQADLRRQVCAFGAVAMALALLLSLLISQGLTGPIKQLVRATNQIREGNFNVNVPVRSQDEIGNLTESFNGMAAGLLLKEKYRRVLDLVADKGIADELINGSIELGGEERLVSVLFCDIRGFTALTENMAPPEVVHMLNEHFEPLTRVVYQHNGVVDKYVGDLIMAIFGAPKDFGNNAEKAVRCALAMIRERQELNRVSKYPISVGIGVASGKALAGMMGAEDRRGYTVLGPKVNLASRLCSQAGRMEVIVDEETFSIARGWTSATALEPLKLKGFATPIPAYKIHELRGKSEYEMAQV